MSTNLQESTFFSASDTGLNGSNPPNYINYTAPRLNSKGLALRDRNSLEFYFTWTRSPSSTYITAVLQGSPDNQNWADDTAFTPVQVVAGVIPIMDLVSTSFKRSWSQTASPVVDTFSWSIGGNGTSLKQLNHNYVRLANIYVNGGTTADALTVTALARKFLG